MYMHCTKALPVLEFSDIHLLATIAVYKFCIVHG